ncbi:hypothetical protein GCM10009850_022950 [Nonomuraea monospora]|uniref:Secreted protein n=1 Tax=Nonomuraea monospora TaxID=568818 RepID=A0ABN3CC97_9ACTN
MRTTPALARPHAIARPLAAVPLLAVALLLVAACAAAPPVQAADPPGQRRCAGADQRDFDAGMGARVVTAGPAAMAAYRLSPAPERARARTFKLAVRLPPGADVTLATRTPGTALLFDESRYRADNSYTLDDGTPSYRFTGCAGTPALWVGAVITTGPTTVTIEAGGHTVEVTAYTGQPSQS